MSLKTFHLVFVTITTILFVFLALWAFAYVPEASAAITAFGIMGAIGAVIMPVYGVVFYRKAARIHL